MNDLLYKSWWMLAARGALAITFGVLALMWPGLTLLAMVGLFAAYAFFSGAAAMVAAIVNRRSDDDWWLLLFLGIAGIAASVLAVLRPDVTALAFVFFLAAYAMLIGILDIATAIRLRRSIRGEWLLAAAGAVAVAFGMLVFLFPDAGALAMIWLIGVYAIASGIMLLVLGLRARRWTQPATMDRRFRTRRRDDVERPVHGSPVHV